MQSMKHEEESFSSMMTKVAFQKSDSGRNIEPSNISSVVNH